MASREEIKTALKILDEAIKEDFLEIKQDILHLSSKLKKFLNDTEKSYLFKSESITMVESWYKFDDNFFQNLKIEYNPIVDNFIKEWLVKESDWKYPSCYMMPYSLLYVEYGLKSSLTYILTNKFTLNEVKTRVRERLKKTQLATLPVYRVNELDKHLEISHLDLPYGQIGSFLSVDYLIYCAYEQIINFINSLSKVLRPGGKCLLHITDADKTVEWDLVKNKKRTFCNTDVIQKLTANTSLELKNVYKINETYTFVELQQSGNLSSQKISATKIEEVR